MTSLSSNNNSLAPCVCILCEEEFHPIKPKHPCKDCNGNLHTFCGLSYDLVKGIPVTGVLLKMLTKLTISLFVVKHIQLIDRSSQVFLYLLKSLLLLLQRKPIKLMLPTTKALL